jgi:CheY-like chemotaxis protein
MGHDLNRTNLRMVIAEDNDDEFLFLEKALRHAGFVYPINRLKNGGDTIDYFQSLETWTLPAPDILLLDVDMPVKTGVEVLEWLRSHSSFRDFPVIILSSCENPIIIQKLQRLGIFKFLRKSLHHENVILALESFMVAPVKSSDIC